MFFWVPDRDSGGAAAEFRDEPFQEDWGNIQGQGHITEGTRKASRRKTGEEMPWASTV